MAIIEKTYWKWDSKYNIELFSLGKIYSLNDIKKEYNVINNKTEYIELSSKKNESITIKIKDHKIIQKNYSRGGNVEGLKIEQNFQGIVEEFVEKYLERCSSDYKGQQLILCYLDLILGLVILKLN